VTGRRAGRGADAGLRRRGRCRRDRAHPASVGLVFVLGAVLASTDPVAVAALGRRLSLPSRVQAESPFKP
jgi:hypothetical protein